MLVDNPQAEIEELRQSNDHHKPERWSESSSLKAAVALGGQDTSEDGHGRGVESRPTELVDYPYRDK